MLIFTSAPFNNRKMLVLWCFLWSAVFVIIVNVLFLELVKDFFYLSSINLLFNPLEGRTGQRGRRPKYKIKQSKRMKLTLEYKNHQKWWALNLNSIHHTLFNSSHKFLNIYNFQINQQFLIKKSLTKLMIL